MILFNDELPVLVVDLRVSLFALLFKAQKDEELWDTEDLIHFWKTKLHLPLTDYPKQRYHLVIVDDFKYNDGTYWRTRHLDDLDEGYPKYKGNRKPEDRPKLYYDLHEAAVKYIKENDIPYFNKKGYEADDFAGLLCKLKSMCKANKRPTILFTVDSDWGQLVNDESQTIFYYSNRPCWKNPLRTESDIMAWFSERQAISLDSVRDIVDVKSEKGDTADNLIPGSPKGVIDLLEPSRKLPKHFHKKIIKELENPKCHTHPKHAVQSQLHINRKIIDNSD